MQCVHKLACNLFINTFFFLLLMYLFTSPPFLTCIIEKMFFRWLSLIFCMLGKTFKGWALLTFLTEDGSKMCQLVLQALPKNLSSG